MLVHKHLIITAKVNKPPSREQNYTVEAWFRDLVNKINMKIMYGPVVLYCDNEGNKGMTGFCIIETSHIALHTWDEEKPGTVQLDVYSCADFDLAVVIDHMKTFFDAVDVEVTMIDRGRMDHYVVSIE